MDESDTPINYNEHYLKLLHEVTIKSNESETIEDALRFGMERICEILKWKIGHLCSYQNTVVAIPTNLWYIQADTNEELFRSFIESAELCGEEGLANMVMQQNKSIWQHEVSKIPYFKSFRSENFGFQTAVAIPVWIGNEITAVLEFYTTDQKRMDSEEMKVMEDVGIQLGRVVERHQAYQVLRNSERKFRSVFEEAGVGMALIDQNFRFLHCNKALLGMLEYKEKEFLQKVLSDICHPDDSIQFQEFSSHLFQHDGSVFTTENGFKKSRETFSGAR